MPETQTQEPPQYTNPIGCLVRMFWLVGGLPLLFIALNVWMERKTSLSFVDPIYWGLVALLVGVRFADIKWLKGTTSEGEPSTMTHWRKYSLLLVAISLALWLVAHGAVLLFPK